MRTLLALANHVRTVLASRHGELQGGGREVEPAAEKHVGVAGRAAGPGLRLPVGVRRQIAQQIARLMQRQWLQSVPAEENDRADHDVVGR